MGAKRSKDKILWPLPLAFPTFGGSWIGPVNQLPWPSLPLIRLGRRAVDLSMDIIFNDMYNN